ncbi:hypothetical protein [Testudinibacter aquarius]|uniref:Uncharacterized protein n=1 Tax=Testudinibacter aquarius TaxID=1524974 RepID=A0A4R3Y7K2_9PAST|nr:hypothetical protein [Testudinibacter aquarius]KAE9527921.1 hypothetical protein A1D24_01500 [Testudinibacter aquarius]TCV86524.1 hypothetical protein EDC16_10680 [Testudinibacter aquarius]TNG93590.1 hypothetical protein FHQ21_01035 [Testudinibacter aquarius]
MSNWKNDPELEELLNNVKERRPHLWSKLSKLNIQASKAEAEEFNQLKRELCSIKLPSNEALEKLTVGEYNKLAQSVEARYDVVLLLCSIFK